LTEYDIALTGLHARNEKTIQATQDWERSRINDTILQENFRRDCDALMELEEGLGVRYASDGQITLPWQDLFRPISAGFDGVEPGPMVRWFNTNTFFFTPIVTGPISSDGRVFSKIIGKALSRGVSSLKIILPDPLTFAELAEDRHFSNREKLQFAYSEAIAKELRELASHGVKYVQFSSPSLVYRLKQKPISKSDLKQLGEAVRTALKGVSMISGFYPFFGDASPYLPDLFDVVPTDEIGIDLTQTDDSSLAPTSKGVIAGIVDSRTTYLEDVEALASRVEEVRDRTGTKRLTLAPSAGLRYIPRSSADEKLELLGRLRSKVGRRSQSKSKPRASASKRGTRK
jgi:methionine synthase II (cobalamin-independent)